MAFSAWDVQPQNRPGMANSVYNPALGHNFQTRGLKGLCPRYNGDTATIPPGHCVLQLQAGHDPNSKVPWHGSINGVDCTIMRGVPSIVPDEFALHLAETVETIYQQQEMHREMIPVHQQRWPFIIVVPPKGEIAVHLQLLVMGEINPAASQSYRQEIARRGYSPGFDDPPNKPKEVYPEAKPVPATEQVAEMPEQFVLRKSSL